MATGPDHFREAENLLALAENLHDNGGTTGELLAAAQVHATLALAAATALSEPSRSAPRETLPEWNAWQHVAGCGQG